MESRGLQLNFTSSLNTNYALLPSNEIFKRFGSNGESRGQGNKNTSRIKRLIQEGTLRIIWTNWKE